MAWDRRNSQQIGQILSNFGASLGQGYLERAKKRQQEEEMQQALSQIFPNGTQPREVFKTGNFNNGQFTPSSYETQQPEINQTAFLQQAISNPQLAPVIRAWMDMQKQDAPQEAKPRRISTIPTGKTKTEGSILLKEVQDIDEQTRQPIAQPRFEPWQDNSYKPIDPRQIDLRIEGQLRTAFNNDVRVKNYKGVVVQYQNALEALKLAKSGNRIAADQAIVTTLNKILDPQSVVRESEYARTPEGAALVNRIEGYAESLTRGGLSLKDSDREEIVNMITKLHDNSKKAYDQARNDYSENAKSKQLVPFNVVGSEIVSPSFLPQQTVQPDSQTIGRFKVKVK